jgi:diadenosine tetraphosphate (Ap4A) HIT family hydrolase
VDCDFCAEFAARGGGNRIIIEDAGWVLLPTRGCFTPGYCLFMPLDHIDAAADLSATELVDVEASVERMRARIESVFGSTIVAEHGSRDCQRGAACCMHCHLHLIPVPDPDAVAAVYCATGGTGTALSGLSDLPMATEGPYLYLSPRAGEHLCWPAGTGFPRQYVRRVCARLHNVEAQYDWRDHVFDNNIRLTLDTLRPTAYRQTA